MPNDDTKTQETYYKNDVLNPDLLDQEAQEAANSFFKDPSKKLTKSQLRNFYGDIKTQERRWQASKSDDEETAFQAVLPMIKLLKAKSEYALQRGVIPPSFRDWLWKHIDKVNSARDFKAFLLHFEAVVGFSYERAEGK